MEEFDTIIENDDIIENLDFSDLVSVESMITNEDLQVLLKFDIDCDEKIEDLLDRIYETEYFL